MVNGVIVLQSGRGIAMVETVEVAALPLAPRNPLPYPQQMKAAGQITPASKRCVMPAAR